MSERTWEAGSAYQYGFNRQESVFEISSGGEHKTAKFWEYDARIARRWQLDPKPNQSISQYACLANSPILYMDILGDTIKLLEATDIDYSGNYIYKKGQVSSKTQSMLEDVMKTDEGRAYFAQFAVKGQKIGGHTFTENGKYSKQNLTIQDFSLSEYDWDNTGVPIVNEGTYVSRVSKKNKNVDVFIQLMSFSHSSKYDLGETFAHEAFLHGTDGIKEIEAFLKGGEAAFETEKKKDPGGEKDHAALDQRDTKHAGYLKYLNFMNQMGKLSPNYLKHLHDGHQNK
jgi:hypothetical protein